MILISFITNSINMLRYCFLILLALTSPLALAAEASSGDTQTWAGFLALGIFIAAYTLVILEERTRLRKSKPVLLAAGLIWVAIAIYYPAEAQVGEAIRHNFLEYAELFFFLLVAMTYINAMLERGVFDALRSYLISRSFSYRQLFWVTGWIAFFLSPVADNLTTALILAAVVMAVAGNNSQFIAISCINIVVAANAGGAFSPFGDITTLMVWQKGMVSFAEFFQLIGPALTNFLVPAFIMQFAVCKTTPKVHEDHSQPYPIKTGGMIIVGLFFLTIATAVSFQSLLNIAPVYGMMLGLAYLKFYGYYLRRKDHPWSHGSESPPGSHHDEYSFDVFDKIAHAEWDTLFFFYGVIMAVGGLGYIGYLELASGLLYEQFSPTYANIAVGLLSALVDNIPVMYAVLTMEPNMPLNQWLLVTLTAGVGGSLLSIGSAAGVALMGQARGHYTFFSHLRWTPVIALGYGASIGMHMLLSGI
jgi:NhaD family Na+/H+ antiporter